jgi:tight adherence protein C
MLSSLLSSYTSVPGLLAPIAVAALIVGGAALISSGIRTRGELLARRVDLVRPSIVVAAAAAVASEAKRSEQHLFRQTAPGLTQAQRRYIIRSFSKFHVRSDQILWYFTAVRVAVAASLGIMIMVWARHQELFAASALIPVLIGIVVALAGWYLPMTLISFGVDRRAKTVSHGLPDALELLVVCVEAGLSLENGLERVIRELGASQPALTEELALTSADLRILPSREQALANLGERIDLPGVKSVIATLSQSMRYGSPLAKSLRTVAAEMRNDFMMQLEERANRLPTLLTLPVVLFILPTLFLILGGPAALKMIDLFPH